MVIKMKSLLRYMSAAVILAGLAACEPDFMKESDIPMPEVTGAVPELVFEGTSDIAVHKYGGEYEARVRANLPWMAESKADWIILTGGSRGQGGSEYVPVAFTVNKNTETTQRSGKIRIWIDNDNETFINVVQEPLALTDLGTKYYAKPGAAGDGSSWENAGNLSELLSKAVNADQIHIAEGTYVPERVIPGGGTGDHGEGDKTFYVGANISIVGGYPADASEGAVADPAAHPVILSGEGKCYHVMVIAAPKNNDFQVNVSGVTITGGKTAASGTGNLALNGALIYRFYGGGLVIGGSNATIENCVIKENISPGFNAGVFNTVDANTTMRNCTVSDNSTLSGNGAGIWNSAAVLVLDGCTVTGNASTGVGGGIYCYDAAGSKRESCTYVYNSLVSGNNAAGGKISSRGGGIYVRESARCVVVNSTISGNAGGNGAGIAVYGASGSESELHLISSTVTGNSTGFNVAGVEQMPNTKVYVYNSIVSGNKAGDGDADICVTNSSGVIQNTLVEHIEYSVNGQNVYVADKVLVEGRLFDYSMMLGALNDGVCVLSGTDNPARSYGMSADALRAVRIGFSAGEVPEDIIGVDAKGNARTGNVMGAYIGN